MINTRHMCHTRHSVTLKMAHEYLVFNLNIWLIIPVAFKIINNALDYRALPLRTSSRNMKALPSADRHL